MNDDNPLLHPEQYVNYGLEVVARTPDLLRLRMDTWYYADSDHLGDIALGNAGVTAETGMPAFVVDQLARVFAAFRPYVRFRPIVRIGHQPTFHSMRAFVSQVTASTEMELLAELQTWLQRTSDVVTLLLSDFDLCLAVRTYRGTIVDQWLPLAGRLSFFTRLESIQGQEHAHALTSAWQGRLDLRVLSLFRCDNEAEIQHARALWKQFRDANPELDLFPEEADEDPIVVLAELPEGTPLDNRELCKRNLLKLKTMIRSWEEVTCSHFRWAARVG